MRKLSRVSRSLWLVPFAALLAVAPALAVGTQRAGVISETYEPFSVEAPSPDSFVVCHGFGCKYRVEIALTGADRARLAQILNAGKGSAVAERRAIAVAGAWFDRRIAPVAGTVNHVAAAGAAFMYDSHQYDCIDASRNTTTLLLLLDEMNLLRHHSVEVPVSRGAMVDGRPFHTTAVIAMRGGGPKFAVDAWTRRYGEPPDVLPLDAWLAD